MFVLLQNDLVGIIVVECAAYCTTNILHVSIWQNCCIDSFSKKLFQYLRTLKACKTKSCNNQTELSPLLHNLLGYHDTQLNQCSITDRTIYSNIKTLSGAVQSTKVVLSKFGSSYLYKFSITPKTAPI